MLSRDSQDEVGKVLDLRQAAGGLEVAHQALLAGGAQLGRRSFGLEVEAGFQARKDADEQFAHAGQALGLRSTMSPRRLTSSLISRSSSVAGSIGRRSGRVRTWSAMVRASRGSDLFSPPTVPCRAD